MVSNSRPAVGSIADRLAVYASPELVTYEPHALNALIATVAAREVAGRLQERAAWHRHAAAAADVVGDAVEECQPPATPHRIEAEWHRAEAADLDALAARELGGGEVR